MLQNLKGSLFFTVFAIVRFFQRVNFRLKITFSYDQRAISNFCFSKDWCFFYATFLKKLFSSKPPSIFTRNETFSKRKGLLKVFGTMRLTGDLHQKNFSKNFEKFSPSIFCFLKSFPWRKMGFCCFQLVKKGFRDLCVKYSSVLKMNFGYRLGNSSRVNLLNRRLQLAIMYLLIWTNNFYRMMVSNSVKEKSPLWNECWNRLRIRIVRNIQDENS